MTDLGNWADYDGEGEGDTGGETSTGERTAGEQTDADDRFEEMDVEPVGEDAGIGTLAASEGLRICEDDRDTCLRAYVTADNRSAVRLGTYLLVPYPDEAATAVPKSRSDSGGQPEASASGEVRSERGDSHADEAAAAASSERASGHVNGETLFCRITGLEYVQEFRSDDATEIHARRAMRQSGIDERDYKFMATLEPVAVLYGENGELKRRMTDRVPKPEAVVREATDTREIKTGLKMPENGVFLGHLAVGGEKVRTNATPPTIDYRVKDDYTDGDPLVFRHTLIAGGTGSGKTHGAKNVLRQYLSEERSYPVTSGSTRNVRAALVQFDPQDEYAQMHDDNPDVTAEDERAWEREGIAHGGHDDTIAFVPKVGNGSYAADHHRAEQVEFTIPFSMVKRNKWLVAGGSLNDNQYNALDVLLGRFFRQRGGDSGTAEATYDGFIDFIDDPTLREELDESGRVHEATYDAVKRRVINSAFRAVFDQDAKPLTEQVKEFVRPGRLTVVPTYHINNTRATELIVLAVSSLLIDEKLSNAPQFDRIKETPLVLGMDEAHNFLTDAESVQARKVIGKFTEAAKQGRKERLGLFLITQDPQDIAQPVFKQINTKIVLNLGDEDAIKSVNIPATLEKKVPYMEKGQMVVYSPDNSEPVELAGLNKCLTRHGRD